jgi:hypothetical protein
VVPEGHDGPSVEIACRARARARTYTCAFARVRACVYMSCVQVTIVHQIWKKWEALDGFEDWEMPPQLLRNAKGSNLLSFESAAVAPLDGLHASVAACSRNLLAAIGTELETNKALQIAQKVDVKVPTACVCARACVRLPVSCA